MLDGYNETLERYAQKITGLIGIAHSLGNAEAEASLADQLSRIRNIEFHIMILGLFKRGKSTLINYFLGANVLPTGVVPITSVATSIRFGETPHARVLFRDASALTIRTDEIDAFASERGNPGNEKNVDRIDIHYPSPFLKNGVVLVDTPGTGSTIAENTKEAYRHLPRADAAIFLLSSDTPVSETELNYLLEVREHYAKVYILQNKIDYLSPSELEEVVAFTENILAQLPGDRMKVYPVSTRLALEGKMNGCPEKIKVSGMACFEAALERFLLEEKAVYLLDSNKRKIRSMLDTLSENAGFQLDLLQSPIDMVEAKVRQFQEKLLEVAGLKKECMAVLGVDLDAVMADFLKEMERFKKESSENIKQELADYAERNKHLKHAELKEGLQNELRAGVVKAFKRWNGLQEEKVRQDFKRVAEKFTGQLNRVQAYINDITREIFGFRLLEDLETLDLKDNDLFYFRFGTSGNPSLLLPDMKSLKGLLSKEKKREYLLENFFYRVDVEMQKNADGLRWSYVQKIKDSRLSFERIYQEKVDEIVSSIQKMIARALEKRNAEKGMVEERLKRLQAIQERLMREKEDLDGSDEE